MIDQAKIDRAAKFLDAQEHNGAWIHFAAETNSWWRVSSEGLAELVDYLDHEDPEISGSAYSHWCAGVASEEMPEGWTPEHGAISVRVSDVGGSDWGLDDRFDREPGESLNDWADRVAGDVIDEIPDCGGYDDDGPVTARLTDNVAEAAVHIYLESDVTGTIVAMRSIAIDEADPENEDEDEDDEDEDE